MNKICVFAKNKNTYFIRRLIEEVGEGVALFDPWTDFELPEAEKYVARTTGVYGNDLDLMILKALPQEKLVNPYQVLNRFRSKAGQYQWFDENQMPILPWVSLPGTDLVTVEKFFRLYPRLVVKPLRGQGGWGVEAFTWDEFKSWWKKKKGIDENYLLQPLIKGAEEYRYIFMKGTSPLILKRVNTSGIAANFQREGKAEVSALPPDVQSTLESCVQSSGALYGAIDLFLEEGRLTILELNAVPGLEQAEKVSGMNLIQLFLNTCL